MRSVFRDGPPLTASRVLLDGGQAVGLLDAAMRLVASTEREPPSRPVRLQRVLGHARRRDIGSCVGGCRAAESAPL